MIGFRLALVESIALPAAGRAVLRADQDRRPAVALQAAQAMGKFEIIKA